MKNNPIVIELENGTKIALAGRQQSKQFYIIQEENDMDREKIMGMMNEGFGKSSKPNENTIKFMDENGQAQAELPNDNELMNAIVGYEHDPETHVYNRAERRRIIRAAKELERKNRKNGQ